LIVIRGKDDKGKTIPVALTSDVVLGPDKRPRWQKGGTKRIFTGGQLWWTQHDPDFKELLDTRSKHAVESPRGEWTRVECVCEGKTITVSVNGTASTTPITAFPPRARTRRNPKGSGCLVGSSKSIPWKINPPK